MKIAYKNFINSTKVTEQPIYLIIGKPYHLQNEVEYRLEHFFKRKEYEVKKVVVDSDFNIDLLKDDYQNHSLFSAKKFFILNIITNTIPKNLSDYLTEIKFSSDSVILIKLGPQSPSFKKTKIFSKIEHDGCIIEVHELKGVNLIDWVRKKFSKNKIKYTDELFKKLIDKNEGNTSAISQELYKMSILGMQDIESYFDFIQKEYKFTEFDLTDSLLDGNLKKSLKILNYLKSINSPEVYILFLINNEINRIYFLANHLSPQPYIPAFKRNTYDALADNYSKQHLMDLLQYCYAIDKSIKLGTHRSNIWDSFEILVTAFITRKSFTCMEIIETA